jgi:hypothetical protein
MTENNYVTVVMEDGAEQKTFEYAEVFDNDPILVGVINKVGGIFAERGFQLTDMAQSIKSIQAKLERNKISGRNISALDELALKVQPDIYLYLDFHIKDAGFGQKKVDRFSITAIDTYSNKNVAEVSGAGPNNSGVESELVAERVLAKINELENDMIGVFKGYSESGREITLEFQVAEEAVDGECWDLYGTEINGEMLVDYIQEWATSKSVKAANVSPSSSGEGLTIEMNIPLKTADGKSLKAFSYALQILRDKGLKAIYKMRPDEQGLGYCIINITSCK